MNFTVVYQSLPLLMQGLLITIKIWIGSLIISLLLGILVGIARCRLLRIRGLSSLLDTIVFVLRGIPFYVQLLIAYYAVPDLFGFNISPVSAGMISLGLCSAAYVSQIVRGGIHAIPSEQWEAACVLGLNKLQTLWYVILPQTMRIIIPMLAGECDQLLKSTSLISTIGVIELTRAGMNIIAREMQVIPVYIAIALLYLMIFALFNMITTFFEKRSSYDYR